MALVGISRSEGDCLAMKYGAEKAIDMMTRLSIQNLMGLVANSGCSDLDRLPAEERYEITVPGFEDIIHLGGYERLSDGEAQLYSEVYKAYPPARAREILVDMLGENKVRGVERRRETARRINNSPTPEVVREIGEIMTIIDNVQDGLITLTYAARLLAPLAAKIAPRLLAKAVPVVGWISLASDVLNLLQILNWLKSPRSAGKRGLLRVLEASPTLRGKKLLAYNKLGDLLPSFSEAIQVAQTSDWLFGYGVSLGPLMGFVQDGISGLVREFVPGGGEVTVRGVPFVDDFGLGIQGQLYAHPDITSSPTRKIYRQPASAFDLHALKVLQGAPYILQLGPELPIDIRVSTLAAVALATEVLNQSRVTEGMVERLGAGVDMPLPAPKISSSVKRLLDLDGIAHNGENARFPLPTEPTKASARLQAALLAPRVVEGNRSGFEADKSSMYSVLGGHLITSYCDSMLRVVDGTDVKIETVNRPEAKAIFTLLHYDLLPRLEADPALLERAYGLLSAEYIKTGKEQLTFTETAALVDVARAAKPQNPL